MLMKKIYRFLENSAEEGIILLVEINKVTKPIMEQLKGVWSRLGVSIIEKETRYLVKGKDEAAVIAFDKAFGSEIVKLLFPYKQLNSKEAHKYN